MKKKIILGLLVLVVLLFFIASSWALDWKRARQQYYEHPDQELESVPVTPQPVKDYPSMIKFIFVLNIQNLPVLISVDKSSVKTESKAGNSTNNSIIFLKKTK